MKKLIIHIGFHRTGTSAVQSFLRNNRDSLYDNGVALVLREDIKPSIKSFDLLSMLRNQPCKTVIVSEENLAGPMPFYSPLKRKVVFYDNLAKILKKLSIASNFYDLSIVVSVRRQDMWIDSLYFYNVYKGLRLSIEKFADRIKLDDLDWQRYQLLFEKYNLAASARYYVQDTYRNQIMSEWVPDQFSLPKNFFENTEPVIANSTMSQEGTRIFLAMNMANIAINDHFTRRDLRNLLWATNVKRRNKDISDVLGAIQHIDKAGILYNYRQKASFEKHFSDNKYMKLSEEKRFQILDFLNHSNDRFCKNNIVHGKI